MSLARGATLCAPTPGPEASCRARCRSRAGGTTVTLLGTSTVTDSNFNDIFVGPTVVAQVVGVPEPATAALLGLGLGGLTLIGRKRSSLA